MEQNNTTVTLSEARGALNSLLVKLSGDDAAYWLRALRRMLRKQEELNPPTAIPNLDEALSSREDAMDKIEGWIEFLKTIPCVEDASFDQETGDIINIDIYSSAISFLKKWEGESVFIALGDDGKIRNIGDPDPRCADEIFNAWFVKKEENFRSLKALVSSLLELSISYKKSFTDLHDGELTGVV